VHDQVTLFAAELHMMLAGTFIEHIACLLQQETSMACKGTSSSSHREPLGCLIIMDIAAFSQKAKQKATKSTE
jgi:hypothetical protein